MKSRISNNFKETQKLGEQFGKNLKKGSVVALYGELGAGKTTFVQGLAKGLGIKKRIISPSFIVIRRYDLRIKNKELRIRHFYHIDLYRIDTSSQIEGLGLEEILKYKNAVVVIEWAEKLGNLLPKKRIDVRMEYLDSKRRRLIIFQ